MKQVSEKERRLQDIAFEIAKLELESSYEDQIDSKRLREREILLQNFSAHLSKIVDLGNEEISRRLRVPFEEDHIVLEKNSHQKMIDLVEGAFMDVLRSREDVDLAKWSHSAIAPVKPLVSSCCNLLSELSQYFLAD